MRRLRLTALALCAFSACADCDLMSEDRAVANEIHEAQVEFAALFVPPPSVSFAVKQAPNGDQVVDVTLKFDKPPKGFTPDQVRTNANIVVRKHVRKVRDVTVSF